MTDERWLEILSIIEDKFSFEEKNEFPTDDKLGTVESVVFNGTMGKVKLERTSHPKRLGTKTQYSKRIGGDVSVEHVYSDTEMVNTLKAYHWNDDSNIWEEITPDAFIS